MGILNVTPDSFSGDGLLAAARRQPARRPGRGGRRGRRGGWSTRAPTCSTSAANRRGRATRRSTPTRSGAASCRSSRAVRAALPDMPLSIDTTKPAVAEAALDAGADLVNDVWGVGDDDALARLAADRGVPIVLMHNRAEPRYTDAHGRGRRRPPARRSTGRCGVGRRAGTT